MDECDEDGWETGYSAWLPQVMEAIGAPAPAKREGPPAALFAFFHHHRRSPVVRLSDEFSGCLIGGAPA